MAQRGARERAAPPSLRRHLAGCRRVLRQWRALVEARPSDSGVEPLLDAVERELDVMERQAERLETLEGEMPHAPAEEPLLDEMERELDMLESQAERLEALVLEMLEHQPEPG